MILSPFGSEQLTAGWGHWIPRTARTLCDIDLGHVRAAKVFLLILPVFGPMMPSLGREPDSLVSPASVVHLPGPPRLTAASSPLPVPPAGEQESETTVTTAALSPLSLCDGLIKEAAFSLLFEDEA